jgi:hypothetical protein
MLTALAREPHGQAIRGPWRLPQHPRAEAIRAGRRQCCLSLTRGWPSAICHGSRFVSQVDADWDF